MARDNITQYSATASANTVVADINIDEGCAPSGINNAIREVMAALKDVDTGTTTLTSPAFTSSTSATIKTALVKHTNDTTSMTIATNGAVTFAQAPSLPDNTVATADVQDNAITLAKMAGLTRGNIIYGNASGDPTALAVGTGVLTGDGTDVSWAAGAASVPSGMIMAHTTATEPSGWLECDGAAISRSTYSALFAVISDDYGAGDGSSTFNVPDLRGTFIRGFANGSANDADRAARTDRGDGTTGDVVGSKQADAIRNITGSISMAFGLHPNTISSSGAFTLSNSSYYMDGGYEAQGRNISLDASGSVPTGSDNRPLNVQMMYIIKA